MGKQTVSVLSTPEQILDFRIRVLRSGLELEIRGMSRKGRSCASIIKREFNLKGNNRSVYKQFCELNGLVPKEELL